MYSVYMVVDASGRQLVLKVGATSETISEVRMNKCGYDNMDKCGFSFLRPTIVAYEDEIDYAMILMEYCGEDFFTQIKKAHDPVGLYRDLVSEMDGVYRKSLRMGSDGEKMISFVIDKIKEQYKGYIYKYLDPNRFEARRIDSIAHCINPSIFKYCCFSNWDFTPEDVYLSSCGIKYSDPHENILGIPIVDNGLL